MIYTFNTYSTYRLELDAIFTKQTEFPNAADDIQFSHAVEPNPL